MLKASQGQKVSTMAVSHRTGHFSADHLASGEVGPTRRACSAGWERTFQVENPLSGGPPRTIRGRHASVNAPLRPEVRECLATGQAVRQVTHISATEAADGEMSSGDGQLDRLAWIMTTSRKAPPPCESCVDRLTAEWPQGSHRRKWRRPRQFHTSLSDAGRAAWANSTKIRALNRVTGNHCATPVCPTASGGPGKSED